MCKLSDEKIEDVEKFCWAQEMLRKYRHGLQIVLGLNISNSILMDI